MFPAQDNCSQSRNFVDMKFPVSVVIPVYNREATLERTLRSLDAQSVAPARVVLVDNGSTDRSPEIMARWAEGKRNVSVVCEPKRGACAARNRGLAEVDSEFVCFFDSDDVMLPCHLEDFGRAILRHPEGDLFGRSIVTRMLDGSERIHYFTARAPMFNHLFRSSLSTARFMVRSGLVRQVGGWDESLTGWDDYELGVRLLLATDRVFAVPGAPSVIAYQQEESLTGTDFASHPERWEGALERVREVCMAAGRDDLLRWIDARSMILAAQYALESHGHGDADMARCAAKLAGRLHDRVLANTSAPMRMKLIYAHNLRFRRLTWVLVRLLFPFG